jgi:hypothetical protein
MPAANRILPSLVKALSKAVPIAMEHTYSFLSTTFRAPHMDMFGRFVVHNALGSNASMGYFFAPQLGSGYNEEVASAARSRALGALRQEMYERASWIPWLVSGGPHSLAACMPLRTGPHDVTGPQTTLKHTTQGLLRLN